MRERNRIESAMNDIRMLEREADDAIELWDMAEDEGDTGALAEVEANVRAALGKAKDADLEVAGRNVEGGGQGHPKGRIVLVETGGV